MGEMLDLRTDRKLGEHFGEPGVALVNTLLLATTCDWEASYPSSIIY